MIFTNSEGRRTAALIRKHENIGAPRKKFALFPVKLTNHNYEKSVWMQGYVAVWEWKKHSADIEEYYFASEEDYNIWKEKK